MSAASAETAALTAVGPVTGDFQLDGDVDGSDFLSWQRGFGAAADVALGDGDGNLDGAVDDADLSVWAATFGPGPVSSGGARNLATTMAFRAPNATAAADAALSDGPTARDVSLAHRVAFSASLRRGFQDDMAAAMTFDAETSLATETALANADLGRGDRVFDEVTENDDVALLAAERADAGDDQASRDELFAEIGEGWI
jgi:hypothetical protein